MKNRRKLCMVWSLMVTFSLCLLGADVKAAALDEITPDLGFEFAVVLQGQSTGNISTTAAAPFDLLNVGLVSIGNATLTASLNMSSQQSGMWWISLVSIGRTTSADFAFGVAPLSGPTAQIAVDPSISFVLATGGVISLDQVTAEDPLAYSINVVGR